MIIEKKSITSDVSVFNENKVVGVEILLRSDDDDDDDRDDAAAATADENDESATLSIVDNNLLC